METHTLFNAPLLWIVHENKINLWGVMLINEQTNQPTDRWNAFGGKRKQGGKENLTKKKKKSKKMQMTV